jgi:hypothetical protein
MARQKTYATTCKDAINALIRLHDITQAALLVGREGLVCVCVCKIGPVEQTAADTGHPTQTTSRNAMQCCRVTHVNIAQTSHHVVMKNRRLGYSTCAMVQQFLGRSNTAAENNRGSHSQTPPPPVAANPTLDPIEMHARRF